MVIQYEKDKRAIEEQIALSVKNVIEVPLTDNAKRIEKEEIVELFSHNIETDLKGFISAHTRIEKALNAFPTFTSEQEKTNYWERQMVGYVFERATEAEYIYGRLHAPSNETPLEELEDEIAISHLMIEIARHSSDYGLLRGFKGQAVDAIYYKKSKTENIFEIIRTGEAKLPDKLDKRAQGQLAREGSRHTLELLVDEINELLDRNEDNNGKFPLDQFKELLHGSRLKVADNIGIDLLVPSNRRLPDVSVLATPDVDEMAREKEKRLLANMVDGGDIKAHDFLTNVTKGNIKFINSEFSTTDVSNMLKVIMETTDLNLEFPGEIVKADSVTEKSETLATPEELVTKIAATAPDEEKYLKWLHTYLNSGTHSDLSRDQKFKNGSELSKVMTETLGNSTTSRHATTGIEIEIDTTGLQPTDAKRRAQDALRLALDQHLHEWQDVIVAQTESPETVGKGKILTDSQRKLIDTLVHNIRNPLES